MRILLANPKGVFGNHGDDGLMDVALTRLGGIWPEATFQIVAHAPGDLVARYPHVEAIPQESFRAWNDIQHQRFLGRLHRYMPDALSRRVLALEGAIRHIQPALAQSILEAKSRLGRAATQSMRNYEEALSRANLVVVSGGGHFLKGHESHGVRLLQVLAAARARRTPTVMLSQGILPIEHPDLGARMKIVLPRVGLITLREGRDAVPFLEACGARGNFVVTGDDLIEFAYKARPTLPGTGIGVSLRMARYSEIDAAGLAAIRTTLLQAAQRHRAALLPVPISLIQGESDVVTIRQLLAGTEAAEGGVDVDSPVKAVQQVGRCRIVVAGSYHAGVFALSQGIPVVGLAKSAYYRHKFSGLADQFGTGCQVVLMDEPRFPEVLSRAIDTGWQSAEQVRFPLLAAAARQIKACHAAYQRVGEFVTSSAAATPASHGV
jgi:polysaccharide pyruvyl transferase WcaK-like protein